MEAQQTRINHYLLFFGLTISLSYLLPYNVHPFRAFYHEWLQFVGIAFLLLSFAKNKTAAFSVPWSIAVPLILAATIGIQVLYGMLAIWWDTILPVSYLLVGAIAMVVGATYCGRPEQADSLCRTIVVAHLFAGMLSVGIASLQFINAEASYAPYIMAIAHSPDTAVRAYGNVAQPNQLGLLFCLSIACVWWTYQKYLINGWIAFGMVLFLVIGLVLTQSRIGWLILPLFAIVMILWRKRPGYRHVPITATAPLIGLYFLLVLALPLIAETLVGIPTASIEQRIGESAGSERLSLWRQALSISLANPLLGAGWYEFGAQQVMTGEKFSPSVYSLHSHNIVMNLLAEVGWVVTLPIIFATLIWFIAILSSVSVTKETAFGFLFCAAILTHSMVEFPLWYGYVPIPFALLIGVMQGQEKNYRVFYLRRPIISLIFALLMVSIIGIAADYRRVVTGFRALGWQMLGMASDEGSTEKPSFTLFPHYYDYFAFAKKLAKANFTNADIAEMEAVSRRFGFAPVLMRMSLVYAENNRPADALRTMRTIRNLHPTHYSDAYTSWQALAVMKPAAYEVVFRQLPLPGTKK